MPRATRCTGLLAAQIARIEALVADARKRGRRRVRTRQSARLRAAVETVLEAAEVDEAGWCRRWRCWPSRPT